MDAVSFNKFLEDLPNWAGQKIYFLETAYGYTNYDEVDHKFQTLVSSPNGYRPYSLSYIKPISPQREKELYGEVERDAFVFSIYDQRERKRKIILNGFAGKPENV